MLTPKVSKLKIVLYGTDFSMPFLELDTPKAVDRLPPKYSHASRIDNYNMHSSSSNTVVPPYPNNKSPTTLRGTFESSITTTTTLSRSPHFDRRTRNNRSNSNKSINISYRSMHASTHTSVNLNINKIIRREEVEVHPDHNQWLQLLLMPR